MAYTQENIQFSESVVKYNFINFLTAGLYLEQCKVRNMVITVAMSENTKRKHKKDYREQNIATVIIAHKKYCK